MKQTKKTVTPLAVMNHYKLMYSAGKIAKDGAAHKRMHQLFDDVCTEEKAVKRAKIQIKQHEIA